jgi:hypothetical protein
VAGSDDVSEPAATPCRNTMAEHVLDLGRRQMPVICRNVPWMVNGVRGAIGRSVVNRAMVACKNDSGPVDSPCLGAVAVLEMAHK